MHGFFRPDFSVVDSPVAISSQSLLSGDLSRAKQQFSFPVLRESLGGLIGRQLFAYVLWPFTDIRTAVRLPFLKNCNRYLFCHVQETLLIIRLSPLPTMSGKPLPSRIRDLSFLLGSGFSLCDVSPPPPFLRYDAGATRSLSAGASQWLATPTFLFFFPLPSPRPPCFFPLFHVFTFASSGCDRG